MKTIDNEGYSFRKTIALLGLLPYNPRADTFKAMHMGLIYWNGDPHLDLGYDKHNGHQMIQVMHWHLEKCFKLPSAPGRGKELSSDNK